MEVEQFTAPFSWKPRSAKDEGLTLAFIANKWRDIHYAFRRKKANMSFTSLQHQGLHTWYVGAEARRDITFTTQPSLTSSPNVSSATARLRAFSLRLSGFVPPNQCLSPKIAKSGATD